MGMTPQDKLRVAAEARYRSLHPDEAGFWSRTMSAPAPITEEPAVTEEERVAIIDAIPTSEWADMRSALGVRSRGLFNQDVPTVQDLRNHDGLPQEQVTAPVAPADGRMTNGDPATPRSNPSPWRATNQD